jgi:hypothetical protein
MARSPKQSLARLRRNEPECTTPDRGGSVRRGSRRDAGARGSAGVSSLRGWATMRRSARSLPRAEDGPVLPARCREVPGAWTGIYAVPAGPRSLWAPRRRAGDRRWRAGSTGGSRASPRLERDRVWGGDRRSSGRSVAEGEASAVADAAAMVEALRGDRGDRGVLGVAVARRASVPSARHADAYAGGGRRSVELGTWLQKPRRGDRERARKAALVRAAR